MEIFYRSTAPEKAPFQTYRRRLQAKFKTAGDVLDRSVVSRTRPAVHRLAAQRASQDKQLDRAKRVAAALREKRMAD